MTGYTRRDTADNIANGKIINADDLDNEFNALQTAFNQTNGHVHDGTEGNAPKINTSGLEDNAVKTAKINNSAVTADKLASNAVTTAKITDANVTTAKIADDAVTTAKIAAGAVGTTELANASVTSAKLATDAVALGTNTTGNYVAAGATSGVGLSGSVSSEGGTFTVTSNATNANTANTIVSRDALGNFSAGTITANITAGTATITGGSISGIADLAIADGGTGASTAAGARTNLGLGSLATKSTINNGDWSGTDLAVANGGTGASDAATARANLGLTIGTNVQAFDAQLADVAGLTPTDGNFIVGDGTNFVAESGATARTSLGLGSLATANTINNSNWSGTDLSVANGGTGLSTAPSNGQLLIGNGTGYTLATLTNGGNVTISNTAGGISLSVPDNTNTTYSISAVASGSDASLRLTDSSAGTDDVTFVGGTNVTVTRTDADTITISAESGADNNTTYTIQSSDVTDGANLDLVAGGSGSGTDSVSFVGGTNVTISQASDVITISATDTNTTYSAGTGLTLTGTQFSVTNPFTDADETKLDNIEDGADVTTTTNVVAALTAGSNITIAGDGTISATDTNTTYSGGTGLTLSGTTFNVDTTQTITTLANGNNGLALNTGTTNANNLKITSSFGTVASHAPDLNLFRSNTTAADNDALGIINFSGKNSDGNERVYATVSAVATDVTATSEDGKILLNVRKDSTDTNVMTIEPDNVSVAGNISVTGTVDGRDIATDGTKLDTIESGATADQTKADIDALGINADQLDGQEGTYYLNYSNFTNTPTIPTNNNQLTNGAGYITSVLTSTDAGASAAPVLELYRNSASPADNDQLGQIKFTSENAVGSKVTTATITSIIGTTQESGGLIDHLPDFKIDIPYSYSGLGGGSGTHNLLTASAGSFGLDIDIGSAISTSLSNTTCNGSLTVSNNLNASIVRNTSGNLTLESTTSTVDLDTASITRMLKDGALYGSFEQLTDNNLKIGTGTTTNPTHLELKSGGVLDIIRSGAGSLKLTTNNTSVAGEIHCGGSLNIKANNVVQMGITTTGVTIAGSLSKGSGSFNIEHPLASKADTHRLVHSFLEGPQADLIYRGTVALVAGTATVNIDTAAGMTEGTFVALCRDIQCFTSNESGWTAIKGSVSGNILTITAQDNTCTDTISWMVVGERQDQHMYDTEWTDENGKVIVEPLIPVEENV